jgi:hypothetical protein
MKSKPVQKRASMTPTAAGLRQTPNLTLIKNAEGAEMMDGGGWRGSEGGREEEE